MHFRRDLSRLAHYRGQAGEAYHKMKHGDSPFYDKVIARSRSEKLQPFIKETDVVLEYGVGTGYNLANLHCREKVGFDVADYCREKVEPMGIYFTSDPRELKTWEGRFDIIICHHVLEHIPNPTMVLSRLRRLLKPTGRLLLFIPFDSQRRFRSFSPNEPDMHLFSWNLQSISNLVLALSFDIHEVKLRPSGYERFLAPLAKLGFGSYKAGLWLLRLVLPVEEIFVIAGPRPAPKTGNSM